MILRFEEYIKLGKVKKSIPNIARARSLINLALNRLKFVPKEITKENVIYVFEDYYESLKEILQAFMEANGYHPYSHEAIIAYARDTLGLDENTINNLNRMREIRNDILYRGEEIDYELLFSLINFAKNLIGKLVKMFEEGYS